MTQRDKLLTLVDPDRPAQWEEVVRLSTEMLEAAQAGQWSRVTEQARRRRERVEAFFREPVAAHEAAWVAEGIRRVLDMDRTLLELARRGREESAAAVIQLRRGRQARTAYRSCGGPMPAST